MGIADAHHPSYRSVPQARTYHIVGYFRSSSGGKIVISKVSTFEECNFKVQVSFK